MLLIRLKLLYVTRNIYHFYICFVSMSKICDEFLILFCCFLRSVKNGFCSACE